MKAAAESLAESTLKTLDVGEFTAALVRQATAWSTRRWFYGGKTFAKRLGKSKIFPDACRSRAR